MSKPSIREIFKQNLNQLFINKNVTQKALADFIGVSTATVSDWRKGKVFPRMDRIDRICQFFHIDRSELLSTFDITNELAFGMDRNPAIHIVQPSPVLHNTGIVRNEFRHDHNPPSQKQDTLVNIEKNTQKILAAISNEPERPTITKEEHALLDAYRNAPADKKTIVNLTLGLK